MSYWAHYRDRDTGTSFSLPVVRFEPVRHIVTEQWLALVAATSGQLVRADSLEEYDGSPVAFDSVRPYHL